MASPDLFPKILDAYYEAEFADPADQAAKTAILEGLMIKQSKEPLIPELGLWN